MLISVALFHFIQVCIKHFAENDIERETSVCDEKTGELLSAPLKYPRIRQGGFPTIFPSCPSYLTNVENLREGPEEKKIRREMKRIEQQVEQENAFQETRRFQHKNNIMQRLCRISNS